MSPHLNYEVVRARQAEIAAAAAVAHQRHELRTTVDRPRRQRIRRLRAVVLGLDPRPRASATVNS
jgi:hypothetical protein